MLLFPHLLYWINGFPNVYGKASDPDLNLKDYSAQKKVEQ
jgi:hypothetical protein